MLRVSLRAVCLSTALVVAAAAAATAVAPAWPAIALLSSPPAPVHAASPCDGITGDPNPPIGPGQPDIAGHIVDAGSSAAIAGATVRLYVCDGSTPVLEASSLTLTDGSYAFLDLDGPAWYFVQAVLTGPLAGMTPATGTTNPTNVIDVGAGASGLDLAFE